MIDWSPFDKYPEDTCYCRCGVTYKSHVKALCRGSQFDLVARGACPSCGRTDQIRRTEGSSHIDTIGR